MGVEASLTLGREEMPWVKELVGFNIEVESFSSWRGFYCSWSMNSIGAICLVCYDGRYKCIDVMRRMLIALKRHYAISNVYVYMDMAFSSLESPSSLIVS